MEIIKKLAEKQNDIYSRRPVTVAFFGDSVTQGCFELYQKSENAIETIFDQAHAYHTYFKEITASVFPASPLNVINAGISGDNATNALSRLERDVLSYKPDLVVVCFGLNDCASGEYGLQTYRKSLAKIVETIKQSGAEVIVMTPNCMADHVSPHVRNQGGAFLIQCVENSVEVQNSGMLDKYVECMREVAADCGVPVCEVYAKWKELLNCGADLTELLANRINHPSREMNKLFAYSLFLTMLEN